MMTTIIMPLQPDVLLTWFAVGLTGLVWLLGLGQCTGVLSTPTGQQPATLVQKLPLWLTSSCAGILLTVYIIRSSMAGFFALTNMYESLLAVALGIQVVTACLFSVYKQYQQHPILWVLAQLMAWGYLVAALRLSPIIEPLQPSLVSYWRAIHVPIIMLSYSLLFLSAIGAALYLWVYYTTPKPDVPTTMPPTLPANKLIIYDTWTFHCVQWAFPLLTVGIALGAIWANEAWGTYWNWDPKESMALATLLVFGAYWHLRLQENASKIGLQWLVIIGFMVLLITYFGINLMGVGLHSYGKF
jgi:cytochrome c-type biogenesis protein CcsB